MPFFTTLIIVLASISAISSLTFGSLTYNETCKANKLREKKIEKLDREKVLEKSSSIDKIPFPDDESISAI